MGKKLVQGVINNSALPLAPTFSPPALRKRGRDAPQSLHRDMKDPEFGAELKKAKLDLNPLDGATLERNIRELFALDKALIPKLSEILK